MPRTGYYTQWRNGKGRPSRGEMSKQKGKVSSWLNRVLSRHLYIDMRNILSILQRGSLIIQTATLHDASRRLSFHSWLKNYKEKSSRLQARIAQNST